MTIRKKALGLTAVAVAAVLALDRLQQHRWQEGGRFRRRRGGRHRSTRAAAAGRLPTPRVT